MQSPYCQNFAFLIYISLYNDNIFLKSTLYAVQTAHFLQKTCS